MDKITRGAFSAAVRLSEITSVLSQEAYTFGQQLSLSIYQSPVLMIETESSTSMPGAWLLAPATISDNMAPAGISNRKLD